MVKIEPYNGGDAPASPPSSTLPPTTNNDGAVSVSSRQEQEQGHTTSQDLPQDVKILILGYVFDTHQAITMGVLSKGWRGLWRILDYIALDAQEFSRCRPHQSFTRFVDWVLSNRQPSPLQWFILSLTPGFPGLRLLHPWLCRILQTPVEGVTLSHGLIPRFFSTIHDGPLPRSIPFTNFSSIKHLYLENTLFEPPTHVRNLCFGFQLPFLLTLSLIRCDFENHPSFCLVTPMLRSFIYEDDWNDPSYTLFTIAAPMLTSLTLVAPVEYHKFSTAKPFSSLHEAHMLSLFTLDFDYGCIQYYATYAFDFLRELVRVEHLQLSAQVLEVIAHARHPPIQFRNLHSLTLQVWCNTNVLLSLVYFITCSPFIHDLHIQVVPIHDEVLQPDLNFADFLERHQLQEFVSIPRRTLSLITWLTADPEGIFEAFVMDFLRDKEMMAENVVVHYL